MFVANIIPPQMIIIITTETIVVLHSRANIVVVYTRFMQTQAKTQAPLQSTTYRAKEMCHHVLRRRHDDVAISSTCHFAVPVLSDVKKDDMTQSLGSFSVQLSKKTMGRKILLHACCFQYH
jgi:hypothetical protein